MFLKAEDVFVNNPKLQKISFRGNHLRKEEVDKLRQRLKEQNIQLVDIDFDQQKHPKDQEEDLI